MIYDDDDDVYDDFYADDLEHDIQYILYIYGLNEKNKILIPSNLWVWNVAWIFRHLKKECILHIYFNAERSFTFTQHQNIKQYFHLFF